MNLTKRVDNTFLLLLDVLEATDPFSTIPHGTDSSGSMWALESWNEEVPCSRRNAKNQQGGATGDENPESVSSGPRGRV